MGTNYYFLTQNKELVEKYFPNETTQDIYDCGYELTDFPKFGYEIHLNKLSCGWLPLLQKHRKAFTTFKELEKFYISNQSELEIYDEYGRLYTFKEYKQELLDHANRDKEPVKWVYEVDKVFPRKDGCKSLYTTRCSEEEADLHIPFMHNEYNKTQEIARNKYKVHYELWWEQSVQYWEDPDYPFDWTLGDFS